MLLAAFQYKFLQYILNKETDPKQWLDLFGRNCPTRFYHRDRQRPNLNPYLDPKFHPNLWSSFCVNEFKTLIHSSFRFILIVRRYMSIKSIQLTESLFLSFLCVILSQTINNQHFSLSIDYHRILLPSNLLRKSIWKYVKYLHTTGP